MNVNDYSKTMGTVKRCKQFLVIAAKTLGIGVIVAVMAVLLLIMANSLPTGRMAAHVTESIPMYIHEGDYPSEVPGSPGSVRDNFTEAIMLNMAVYPSSSSPFRNALSSHLLTGDPASSRDTAQVVNLKYALSNLDDSKYVAKAATYARYWHGYLVPLKFLLLLLNPAEIRFFNLVFQLVLVGMNCALIAKKISPKIALAFLGTYVLLNPIATALSFQYYSVFYCTTLGTLAVLVGHDYFQKHKLWPAFFMVLGMVVSFLDFLTYPVLALGVTLVMYAIVRQEAGIFKIIGLSFSWATGYIGFWSLKWILGAIFTGKPISSVKEYILFRLDSSGRGEDLANRYAFNRFDGVKNNINEVTQSSPIILVALIVILLLLLLVILRVIQFDLSTAFTREHNMCIAIIAMYPFMWYLLVLNHSAIHSVFSYRNLGVSLFAALVIALQFISKRSRVGHSIGSLTDVNTLFSWMKD